MPSNFTVPRTSRGLRLASRSYPAVSERVDERHAEQDEACSCREDRSTATLSRLPAEPVLPFEASPQEVSRRMQSGEPIRLIDVREPEEHAIARVEGAELIPMRTVPARLVHLEAQ